MLEVTHKKIILFKINMYIFFNQFFKYFSLKEVKAKNTNYLNIIEIYNENINYNILIFINKLNKNI